jgi:hypothetical protein
MVFDVRIANENLNDAVSIDGSFKVLEKIYGPLDFSIESGQCTVDMKNCQKNLAVNLRQICSKFNDSSFMLAKVFKGVSSILKCPLEVGNYTIKRADVDLKMYSSPRKN